LSTPALKDSTSTRIEKHQISAIVGPRRRLVDPHRRHSLIDSSSRLPPPEHQALANVDLSNRIPERKQMHQSTNGTATRGLVMTSFVGPRRSNPDVPKCNSQQHLRRAAASRIRGRDSSLVWIGPTPPVSRYRLPGFDDTQSRKCRRILLRSARTCMMIDRHHKYRRLPKRNLDRVHVDRNTSGKPNHDIGEIAYTYMHHVRMISASCVYAYLHACMHPLCTDVYIRHASTPNDVRSTSIHHAFGIPFQYQ